MEQNRKIMANNPSFSGMARWERDVQYITDNDKMLTMQILHPWFTPENSKKYPLIVFIQGSGFGTPDPALQLPQLSAFARKGYVVAMVSHRHAAEAPFPACLRDVKTAIRFLRNQREKYHIDSERICVWGTSSGAALASLTALTTGISRYDTPYYAEERSDVQLVVECFGSSEYFSSLKKKIETGRDLTKLRLLTQDRLDNDSPVLYEMSAVNHIAPEKELPPFLLLHGDHDTVVDYHQGEILYDALSKAHKDVQFVTVQGADHEKDFWSPWVLNEIYEFINNHIGNDKNDRVL